MTIEEIKILPYYIESYVVYKDGIYFGEVGNEYELNDLRIQIAKSRAEGFSIAFEDKIITIDNKGQLSEWPYGFYDTTMQQLAELFKIQQQIREDDNRRKN